LQHDQSSFPPLADLLEAPGHASAEELLDSLAALAPSCAMSRQSSCSDLVAQVVDDGEVLADGGDEDGEEDDGDFAPLDDWTTAVLAVVGVCLAASMATKMLRLATCQVNEQQQTMDTQDAKRIDRLAPVDPRMRMMLVGVMSFLGGLGLSALHVADAAQFAVLQLGL